MNGLTWPVGLFALAVAVLSLSNPTDFPVVPVVGTLSVLLVLMRVVDGFRKGLVTEDRLDAELSKLREVLRKEMREAMATASEGRKRG